MAYIEWFNRHADKHTIIMKKLHKQNFTKEQIVDYFDFENMVEKENDFCPLYKEPKKCHNIEELNCYLCACPNFRFDDSGIKKIDKATQFSFCKIDSKDGRQGVYGEKIHQDCSKCTVPHHKDYVLKNFDLEWKKIMHKCSL